MNRLVIIGNGFDLAHGLKTSYNDFVDWYLEKRLKGLRLEQTYLSKDGRITGTGSVNHILQSIPWLPK